MQSDSVTSPSEPAAATAQNYSSEVVSSKNFSSSPSGEVPNSQTSSSSPSSEAFRSTFLRPPHMSHLRSLCAVPVPISPPYAVAESREALLHDLGFKEPYLVAWQPVPLTFHHP
ncbi:hypothetical protein E2C01_043477 [Portunus trituberculatus]|uniref:Uncharacterized protein n=1 Tax=Portunus trituberculatus TaxID=210409 RepID=A0A5B7FVU5_PORTR|nr:hypothetical protein [Portunus trituberculatus]